MLPRVLHPLPPRSSYPPGTPVVVLREEGRPELFSGHWSCPTKIPHDLGGSHSGPVEEELGEEEESGASNVNIVYSLADDTPTY